MRFGWLSSLPLNTAKLVGKHAWLSVLLWLATMAPARAALELRVAIEEDTSQVLVGSSTAATVRTASGETLGEIAGMNGFEARLQGGGIVLSDGSGDRWQNTALWIEPSGENGLVWIGDKWYRGRVLLVPSSGGLTAVNYVDLEHYLYSVLGSEMSPSWPLEALKAQAVAARSYALYQRKTAGNTVFDVGDTQSWQVYEGVSKEAPSTVAAVSGTAGQVLTYNGQIIEAVFHSSSGGYTANVEDVWSEPRQYLRAVQDFDNIPENKNAQWEVAFSDAELGNLISGVGTVLDIAPVRQTPEGRMVSVRVRGTGGERTLSGSALRQALGLKSTRFSVAAGSDRTKAASGSVFVFRGGGWGHGIGMSQWGAYNLAKQGKDYQTILSHYYQNTLLSAIKVE
ncbi:SpoIID/LytB domain-containing protein [Geitlerinema sp. PCC 7407]|uniref:SpoIID/LytB domain-containing protein n=1 Tax=Geitlerinema sp. PCC 7407 TaxID=1173025 RepID=UPI00029FCEFB|nr:SpoIID/LytB domain-containing protein [Geitlerinema sp. PCC 7407]AFY65312.1 SpoIID/LytB domain protein [Geitlerinema sp. PCC 7407]